MSKQLQLEERFTERPANRNHALPGGELGVPLFDTVVPERGVRARSLACRAARRQDIVDTFV